MPQLSGTALLQLALLLSAVPAQYYISRWYGTTATQRFHATARIHRIWKDWSSYLNATAWSEWSSRHLSKVTSYLGFEEPIEESTKILSLEKMLIDNDQGYFGVIIIMVPAGFVCISGNLSQGEWERLLYHFWQASKSVRQPRPPFVFLRVGQVVMETRGNMVGVVVSWDPELRAPAEWVDRVYSDFESTKAERTPHYKVLFNGPAGASSVLMAYLPQTQLERVGGMRPNIPTLEKYFTHFDGERFVLQPWLRAIYPEDEEPET